MRDFRLRTSSVFGYLAVALFALLIAGVPVLLTLLILL